MPSFQSITCFQDFTRFVLQVLLPAAIACCRRRRWDRRHKESSSTSAKSSRNDCINSMWDSAVRCQDDVWDRGSKGPKQELKVERCTALEICFEHSTSSTVTVFKTADQQKHRFTTPAAPVTSRVHVALSRRTRSARSAPGSGSRTSERPKPRWSSEERPQKRSGRMDSWLAGELVGSTS